MASKTQYMMYPPVQDPTEEILAGLAMKKAKADEEPPVDQPDVNPPIQQEFQAQIQPPATPVAPAVDPVEAQLRKRLMDTYEGGIAKQQANVDQYDRLAQTQAQANTFAQNDMSPELNFMSQLTGVDLLKGYNAPKGNEVGRTDLLKLLKEKQTGQGGITDDRVNLLKEMLKHRSEDKLNDKQSRFDQAQDTRAFQDVKKSYGKLSDDLQSFNQSYNVVESAVKTGDTYALQNALSNFARLSGEKGVLTDQDIVRVVPTNMKMKTAQTMAYLRSDPTVPVPPEVQTALIKALGRLKEAAHKRFVASAKANRDQFQSGPGSYPKYGDTLFNNITKGMNTNVANPDAVDLPVEHAAATDIQKAAAQELERRKAASGSQ
jgi:hypothetical protein